MPADPVPSAVPAPSAAQAEELFALANQSRTDAGAGRLKWDPALAAAAMKHCLRMAAEGPIEHRYSGEPDLTDRAGLAGARFRLIEENIALGAYPLKIHQAWLQSPGHRANLLNPEVDSIGIAVVASRGSLFAVEDFSRSVPQLTDSQVESTVANLIRSSGITILRNPTDARAACARDHGMPDPAGQHPRFIMRWQGGDLSELPNDLTRRLASKQYSQASVGSCPPVDVRERFTAYRLAVLLY